MNVDKFGNVVSIVNGKKLQFNPPFFSLVLNINNPSDVDIYTAQGIVSLFEFSIVDQLKVLRGVLR